MKYQHAADGRDKVIAAALSRLAQPDVMPLAGAVLVV